MDQLLGAYATIGGKRVTIRKVSFLFGLLVRDGFEYYWTHEQPTKIELLTPSPFPVVMYQITVDLLRMVNAKVPLVVGMDVFLPAMDFYAKMGIERATREYPELEKGRATICTLSDRGVILRYDASSEPFFLSCMELEDCMVIQQANCLARLMLIEPGTYCFVSEWSGSAYSINRQLIVEIQDNPIRPLDFFVKVDGIGWLPRTRIVLDPADFCQSREPVSLDSNCEPQDIHLSLNCRFFFMTFGKRSRLVSWDRRSKLIVLKSHNYGVTKALEVGRLRFARSLKLFPSQKKKFVTSVALNKRGYLEVV